MKRLLLIYFMIGFVQISFSQKKESIQDFVKKPGELIDKKVLISNNAISKNQNLIKNFYSSITPIYYNQNKYIKDIDKYYNQTFIVSKILDSPAGGNFILKLKNENTESYIYYHVTADSNYNIPFYFDNQQDLIFDTEVMPSQSLVVQHAVKNNFSSGDLQIKSANCRAYALGFMAGAGLFSGIGATIKNDGGKYGMLAIAGGCGIVAIVQEIRSIIFQKKSGQKHNEESPKSLSFEPSNEGLGLKISF